MTDLALDPAVVKLLDYAKDKKVLSWDEVNDLLPETIVNTEKMDQVLVILEQNKIQILEEDTVTDEEVAEDDTTMEKNGVQLLIDPMSYQYLVGAEIDYTDGLEGSQFVIRNPNASSTCGCGSSFSA